MRGGGTINVDGFGVGWFPEQPAGAPLLYRRAVPLWTDTNLAELAGVLRSAAVMAAVRSATVGNPINDQACAPFRGDGLLFSHNGRITGWPGAVRPLLDAMPATALIDYPTITDSVVLFALVRELISQGAGLGEALAEVVSRVLALAPESRLNLLLTDGRTVAATTRTHSLWARDAPGTPGLTISSEPLAPDQAGWRPLPDGRLVIGTADGIDSVTELVPPAPHPRRT